MALKKISPVKKKTLAQCLKEIEKSKARVSFERNKIRDLLSEMEQLEGNCTEAMDKLDEAADALSELV